MALIRALPCAHPTGFVHLAPLPAGSIRAYSRTFAVTISPRRNSGHRRGEEVGDGEGSRVMASVVVGSVDCGVRSACFRSLRARFRSWASLLAGSLRFFSIVISLGAGVGETTDASSFGREHPASKHRQATSRVRAIFFIMAKEQEAWGTRAEVSTANCRDARNASRRARNVFA